MKLAKLFVPFVACLTLSFNGHRASAQTISWQQTNGPLGGMVNALAVNPANGHVFAVIDSDGMALSSIDSGGMVLRSIDLGVSWMQTNTGLTQGNVQAFAFNASGHIFVGTDGGVFRSQDNGDSWTAANTGLTNSYVSSLAIDSSGHIYAGTRGDGVFRSTDNGDSWHPMNNGLANTNIQALAINHSSGYIFVGAIKSSNVPGGIFRSIDNGATWMPANNGLTHTDVKILAVDQATGHVFAGADSTLTIKDGIFRSDNNGDNWTKILETNSRIHALAISGNGFIFAVGYRDVYRSIDGGNNWMEANIHSTIQCVAPRSFVIRELSFAIHPVSGDIFAGNECGVFRSADNGDNWVCANAGLIYTHISSLAVNQATGHIFAGVPWCGVSRSTDNGVNWMWAGIANEPVAALTINSDGYIFAGRGYILALGISTAYFGGIYRSTDNGATWQDVSSLGDPIYSFAIHSNGDIYAGGTIGTDKPYGGVYRSTDKGTSWSKVVSNLDGVVHALSVHPSGRIFAGTPKGHMCQANNGGRLFTLDFFHFFSRLEKHGKSPCFKTSERA